MPKGQPIKNESLHSPRGQFGLLLPSTNTAVEYELNNMLVPGVSWHTGRIFVTNTDMSTSEAMVKFLESLRTVIQGTVESVITCKPDYMVMGMSAETFWGGKKGADEFEASMKKWSGGLDVTTGALATQAALDAYGAKKVGIITPYQPVGDEQVKLFMEDFGYEVKAIHGLKCASATSISLATVEELKDAFRKVDGPDVDALLQAGTNLVCGKVAAEMEIELKKPVIAINTATCWHAYRTNGIKDKLEGWGSLFSEH